MLFLVITFLVSSNLFMAAFAQKSHSNSDETISDEDNLISVWPFYLCFGCTFSIADGVF